MTAQKGDSVILKIGDGATPTEGFVNIGGLRNTSFKLNNRVVESNDLASGRWRNLLSGVGIDSLSIGGDGFFTDAASEETLRGYAFAATTNNYELHFGNGDKLSGAFFISRYLRDGELNSQENCAISLESAGAIVFTTA